jgi:hypothetical protein
LTEGPIPGIRPKRAIMAILRTILAFLIALSVATLPLAGGLALASKPAVASMNPVLTEHDCCDDDSMPMKHMSHDCQAAAGCAAKCFSVYGLSCWEGVSAPVPSSPQPLLVTDGLPQVFANPPFRPPRI